MLSKQNRLVNFLEILLRIPSLFILDEVFRCGIEELGLYPYLLLPLHKENDFETVTKESNHTLLQPHNSIQNYNSAFFGNLSKNHISVIEYDLSSRIFSHLNDLNCLGAIGGVGLQMIILFTASCISLFTLTIWTKHLVKAYEILFSFLLLIISHHFNQKTFNDVSLLETKVSESVGNFNGITQFSSTIPIIVCNIFLQSLLSIAYLMIHREFQVYCRRIVVLGFVLPSLTLTLPFELCQECLYILSIHFSYVILINLKSVFQIIRERFSYASSFIKNEGVIDYIEAEWLRLNIPLIFRYFWLVRSGIYFCIYLNSSESDSWVDVENLKTLLKIILIRGCETFPAILGMSSIFSWICVKIYVGSQTLMMVPHDDSSHVGPVASTLLWIICFQYGVTTLKPASRIIRLKRIIILILACFLHFFQNAVDTVLMSLAASTSLDVVRHVKTLFVSGCIHLFAFGSLYCLWAKYSMSTWLLAVTGFAVEAICKNTISLALYGIFLVDTIKHKEFWYQLDDHVYRIKFTGRMVELLVGVFMLCNSGVALVFESGGFIRAFLFGSLGYLNLWGEARIGWKVFKSRRIAVRKIATLKTVDRFDNLDDVCAICYHELKSKNSKVTIKVTRCRHYYHAVCLRKWLYVQDRCPMCHQTLWPELKTPENKVSSGRVECDLKEE